MKRPLRFAALAFALFLTASLPATYACSGGTEACCKICKDGKACGDSCIAKDKQCNVGPGCACNG